MIISPNYTQNGLITAIYDGDTVICDIDWGKRIWTKDETIRLYGINCNEIKRNAKAGRGDEHVEIGFDQRDGLIFILGDDPTNYTRKVKYHDVKKKILVALDLDGDGEPDVFDYQEYLRPIPVIIQTIISKDEKYGRMLGIIHKDGVNVNEHLRDIIGGVEFYDGKTYPKDYPITPPWLEVA